MPIVGAERIEALVEAIQAGEVVAIPTDTVYGLAALPDDDAALQRLAELKGRSDDQPFAVLLDNVERVRDALEDVSALDALTPFWPGPVTAVVRVRSEFAPGVVTPEGTIGLRMPDDGLTRELIHACGGALAVTSANRSGEPPAEHASEIAAIFGDELLVLDGGPRTGRPPSTIIDLSVEPPVVLREGPIDGAAVLAAFAER